MRKIATHSLLAVLAILPAIATAQEPTTEQSVNPAVKSLADSGNAFALDLYKQLKGAHGNLFFSPYSIDATMMMVRAGAKGATADEITKTLKLPNLPEADLEGATTDLSRSFSADAADNGYELHVANAIWGQAGMKFLPGYVNQLKTQFSAEANWVDFGQNAEAAQTINDWVGKQTHGRINNLITAGKISALTKLILTNAIYFKGKWTEPFKAKATHDAPWNDGPAAASQPSKTVAMMSQRGGFEYTKEDGLSALQMRYAGNRLAMLVILPDAPSGLAAVEKTLDAQRLSAIVKQLQPEHEVQLSFPKMKLETSYELTKTLASMGIQTAFSDTADFSGMDAKRDLFISDVVHKAFVQIDEKGTEAAAATGTMMAAMSFDSRRVIFKADHPFLFLIRDVQSGTILFIGRVLQPA